VLGAELAVVQQVARAVVLDPRAGGQAGKHEGQDIVPAAMATAPVEV
jgi:hypothetical protein